MKAFSCGLRLEVASSVRTYALSIVWLLMCFTVADINGVGEVIFAVNCGGDAHIDTNGIHYQKDGLKVGYASEHGRSLNIRRIAPQDQILYQTERYHVANFAYDVPVKSDGDYVLVLKFSEVWFTEAGRKVFSVKLNHAHVVVDQLDIFASAGFGMAHDELVPFSVRNKRLYVSGENSDFDGTLNVEFVKLYQDNPKINAIYVMRGRLEDAPRLPPLPSVSGYQSQDTEELDEDDSESPSEAGRGSKASRDRKRRGTEPRISDPYASDDPSSMLIPVAAAIGIFIPVVFCLCKL